MTRDEFDVWQAYESEQYARTWIERGMPEGEASL